MECRPQKTSFFAGLGGVETSATNILGEAANDAREATASAHMAASAAQVAGKNTQVALMATEN